MRAAGVKTGAGSAPGMLFERAAAEGARTALRRKRLGLWRDITFAEYAGEVRAVGCALLALGLAPGEKVSIIGENRFEWLCSDLGVQAAGGVSVGIYTTSSATECAYVLGHSGSRFFIVENEEQLDKALAVREELPGLEKIIVIDLEGLRAFSDPMVLSWEEFTESGRKRLASDPGELDRRLSGLRDDDTAILIYTSGTTGNPKGAMLTHRNIAWTARALTDLFTVGADEDVVSFLPLSHIAERLLSTYIALAAGYRVNFIENVDTVTHNIAEISPTFMFSVPRIWEKYQSTILIKMKDADRVKRVAFGLALKVGAAHAKAKLGEKRRAGRFLRLGFLLAEAAVLHKLRERLGFDRLRVAVSGAASISPDVLRFFHSIGVPLRQIYGQTEGSGPTTCHQGEIIDPDNVGPAIPGVEVRIAEDGEILVRGPNVFKGYHRHEQATAEALEGGWLHTGDVGELDERGNLRITDRKKDLIITSGGKNISPQLIENQLKVSPYITDAVLLGDARNYVTALIIIDEENVVKFAQENRIQYTTYASLSETREVGELILAHVRAVNAHLSRVERIKRFAILPKRLQEEEGEVTPTMKVKRRAVNRQFAGLIEDIYRGRAGIPV